MGTLDTETLISLLASGQGRRDESPNIELAMHIAHTQDKQAVEGLIHLLHHKKKDIQSDAIKVLYEIGEIEPQLLIPYQASFLPLLTSKNNRLQWGAMTALRTMAGINPETIFPHLPQILDAADRGSVITRDQGVMILILLAEQEKYHQHIQPLLIEQLIKAPENQLPMYAERCLPVLQKTDYPLFVNTLEDRLPEMVTPTKVKRVEKVIKHIRKRMQ